jgi:hypothetical protein
MAERLRGRETSFCCVQRFRSLIHATDPYRGTWVWRVEMGYDLMLKREVGIECGFVSNRTYLSLDSRGSTLVAYRDSVGQPGNALKAGNDLIERSREVLRHSL